MATAIPKVPLRAWCFTVFNPTAEIEEQMRSLESQAVRLVVGREKCPTTGTPHLQCYIRLHKSIRFAAMKKLLPDGSHIEPRKGTETEASTYCKKDGDILIDKGVDHDSGAEKKHRDDEADEIIEEIEKGESYGRIRNRHKRFCFWHRRNVLDYMRDERRCTADQNFDPSRVDTI